eukprot:scaffold379128_cov39-Prasinocladus_malaysianus.AAC.1
MPGIPQEYSTNWKAILKSCLEKDPSARPTAAELLEHPHLKDSCARVMKRWGSAVLADRQTVDITPVDTAAVLESCRKASIPKKPTSARQSRSGAASAARGMPTVNSASG